MTFVGAEKGLQQQARKEGKGTSELEFWRTSEVVWLWTGSLGR